MTSPLQVVAEVTDWKDCANQIKDVLKVKALRSKVANKVYVDDYRVYLMDEDGEIIKEYDGIHEQAVHIFTAQGPRNALKKIRFVERPLLSFTLKLMQDKEVTAKVIEHIFEYGSVHGYGGERGMGEGRYSWTMVERSQA